MTVISLADLSPIPSLPRGCVVALGFFDGVHIGHRAILNAASAEAAARGTASAVWMISTDAFFKGCSPLLTAEDEKLRLLALSGADYAAMSHFPEIGNMSGDEFVRCVLKDTLGVSAVVCGFNFRFGKSAACGTDELRQICDTLGIGCTVVPQVTSNGESVSSSRIRSLIKEGDVESASALLGYLYSFTLPVVHGKMLGRTLGFPTANQIIPERLVCPPRGVYAAEVTVFNENGDFEVYPGAANIGICPTVTDEVLVGAGLTRDGACGAASPTHPVCETYIAGYSGDLYGKKIKVSFIKRIRGEKKFDGIDRLTEQIRLDAAEAVEIYSSMCGRFSAET